MADGVAITAGAGTTIATDDCGVAGHAQIVKLGIATDGAATAIPADANGLLVKSATAANLNATVVQGTAANLNATVVGTGTLATQESGAALTALQLIDNLVLLEDAAHANGDPGVQLLAVRRDANTTLAVADNDYGPLQLNADGSLKVAITAGAGSGGTSLADDAAFTLATTSFTPVGGVFATDNVDAGDGGAFAMTAARALHVSVQGTATIAGAVTNAGTFAVQNTPVAASTATLANVAAATSSTTLQASNANRLGLRIFNDSTDTVYVKFGSAASATSFTYRLGAGEAVELPVAGSRYTGIVTGLWTGTNGSARMTELTA